MIQLNIKNEDSMAVIYLCSVALFLGAQRPVSLETSNITDQCDTQL